MQDYLAKKMNPVGLNSKKEPTDSKALFTHSTMKSDILSKALLPYLSL